MSAKLSKKWYPKLSINASILRTILKGNESWNMLRRASWKSLGLVNIHRFNWKRKIKNQKTLMNGELKGQKRKKPFLTSQKPTSTRFLANVRNNTSFICQPWQQLAKSPVVSTSVWTTFADGRKEQKEKLGLEGKSSIWSWKIKSSCMWKSWSVRDYLLRGDTFRSRPDKCPMTRTSKRAKGGLKGFTPGTLRSSTGRQAIASSDNIYWVYF